MKLIRLQGSIVDRGRSTVHSESRFRGLRAKRVILGISPFFILISFWVLLYGPYILFGGFVRDDFGFLLQPRGSERYLGWLDQPRGFANYVEFQSFVSSFRTMTGRPIAAVLHGLVYWFFGTRPWPYHLVNLVLFLASVLLVYAAVRNIISKDIAILTAIFAFVYPAASGTVFSSLMMNSNLAGAFWALALYLDSIRHEYYQGWKEFAVFLFLLLSALSYESFIPLFMVNILVRLVARKQWPPSWLQLLKESSRVLIVYLLIGAYRGFAEKLLFTDPIRAIQVSPPAELLARFFQVMSLGVRENLVRSLVISKHSLPNLALLSWPRLLITLASMIFLSVYLVFAIQAQSRFSLIGQEDKKQLAWTNWIPGEIAPLLYVLLAAIVIYVAADLIFVFSGYTPNSAGFESRTQGGIRFAVAFLIATGIKFFYQSFPHGYLKQFVVLCAIGLSLLFTFSIVGQSEAWIFAARYNDFLLQKMDRAIRHSELDQQSAFTLIAELPTTFPHQVNEEPIFGETWDIAPALSLLYPESDIRANVYESATTVLQTDQVIFHGYWEARYPFYVYRFSDDHIYLVNTAQDFRNLFPEETSK